MSLSPEFSKDRPQHRINERLRNTLVASHKFTSRENADRPMNFTSALPIDNEALARLSMERREKAQQQLEEIAQLLPQLSSEETATVWHDAASITSSNEALQKLASEHSGLYLRVLRLISALLLLGVLSGGFTKNAEAASTLPTVTPTAESTGSVLPTLTPTPTESGDEEGQATQKPKATKKATATPTLTPYPTVTNTPTATPESTATPEIILEYAVISVTVANVRSEPSLDGSVLFTAKKGDSFVLSDQQPEDNEWSAIQTSDTTTAYIHKSVYTVEAPPELSPGVGGPIQEISGGGAITPSVSVTETSDNQNSETASEAQEKMDIHLPTDFKEFYESRGGEVAWNQEHQLYQVSMPVGERIITYLLFPQTSAEKASADYDTSNDTPDLEHGLYYLDPKGTIKHSFVNSKGESINHIFHFLTSPEMPKGTDSNLWDSSFEPSGTKAIFGENFINSPEEIMDILRRMFGLPEEESFELYILLSGQNMDQFNDNPEDVTTLERVSLVRGGNDYQSIILDLDNDRKAAVFFTDLDIFGKRYLVDTDDVENGKKFFGADLAIAVLERLIPDLHSREASKQFLEPGFYDTFSSTLIEEIYSLENKYEGEFSLNIVFPEKTLDNYIKTLSE